MWLQTRNLIGPSDERVWKTGARLNISDFPMTVHEILFPVRIKRNGLRLLALL